MSFILDALRKSDSERQQQAAPGLATTPQRIPKPRQRFWVPILIIALLLNVAVFAWIFLTDTKDATDVPATVSSPPTQDSSQPHARSLRKEAASSQVPPPSVSAPEQPPASSVEQPVADVPASSADEQPVPAKASTVSAPKESTSDTIRDALPSFSQLLVGGIISMPALHLDIHVYAGNPSKRFVFINMDKYREGERLKEGPVIEEITSYGAILAYQGNRFTLERD